jgi:hypothetical protein
MGRRSRAGLRKQAIVKGYDTAPRPSQKEESVSFRKSAPSNLPSTRLSVVVTRSGESVDVFGTTPEITVSQRYRATTFVSTAKGVISPVRKLSAEDKDERVSPRNPAIWYVYTRSDFMGVASIYLPVPGSIESIISVSAVVLSVRKISSESSHGTSHHHKSATLPPAKGVAPTPVGATGGAGRWKTPVTDRTSSPGAAKAATA